MVQLKNVQKWNEGYIYSVLSVPAIIYVVFCQVHTFQIGFHVNRELMYSKAVFQKFCVTTANEHVSDI